MPATDRPTVGSTATIRSDARLDRGRTWQERYHDPDRFHGLAPCDCTSGGNILLDLTLELANS